MMRLEQLLENKEGSKLERLFTLYSFDTPPEPKIEGISIDALTAYVKVMDEQFNAPKISMGDREYQTAAKPEDFDPVKVAESLNNPYQSIFTPEQVECYKQIDQEFNFQPPEPKPANFEVPTLENFNISEALDIVNNPTTPPDVLYLSPSQPEGSYTQNFYAPSYEPANLEPKDSLKGYTILDYKPKHSEGFTGCPDLLKTEPYKFYENFRKKIPLETQGILTREDKLAVLTLFRNNDLPNIYEKMKNNLQMKENSINKIIFTNPLQVDDPDDEGPNFGVNKDYTTEIRLPITPPNSVSFLKTNPHDYNGFILNCALVHEIGHGKVNEKYKTLYYNDNLNGFNEHVADAMAEDSMGQDFRREDTKYQNLWVFSKDNDLSKDYHDYLEHEETATKVPGHLATIDMLGNQQLKQQTNMILGNVLDNMYPDEDHREIVKENIYEVAHTYRVGAVKIIQYSKKNTFLSNLRAKRIISEAEKVSIKLWDEA